MHPIWSVGREDWVQLDELEVGEHLLCDDGPVEITSVRLLSTAESVYNLEVHGHHLYQVTELGVLVHNAGLARYKSAKRAAGETAKPKIPKAPTGVGKVPKVLRDRKRTWSAAEKYREWLKRGRKCEQCGKKAPFSSIRGHHIKRWADGGRTNLKNLAIVCAKCHKLIHSGR